MQVFRELKSMISLKEWDVFSLHTFPNFSFPPLVGKSFEERALEKARFAAQELDCWVIADDSGLVVPSLAEESTIHCESYEGEARSDLDHRKKLLEKIKDFPEFKRSASYQCALALAHPDGTEKVVTGICEGTILVEEKGSQGFGFDALFLEHGYNQTYAQLSDETKNRISHRRKAFDKLLLGSGLTFGHLC